MAIEKERMLNPHEPQEGEDDPTRLESGKEEKEEEPPAKQARMRVEQGDGLGLEKQKKLINGSCVRVGDQVVPANLLSVRESTLEAQAREGADVAEGADDLRERMEYIKPGEALAATLNAIFMKFDGPIYPVDHKVNADGQVVRSALDMSKIGHRMDQLARESYVISVKQRDQMRALFERNQNGEVLPSSLVNSVQFNTPERNILQGGDRLSGDHGNVEIGFTVQFSYTDVHGVKHTEDIMFLYGKEEPSLEHIPAANDNQIEEEPSLEHTTAANDNQIQEEQQAA